MQVHVATVKLVYVNSAGGVKATVNDMTNQERLNFSTDHRVVPDPDYPNTAEYPTLKEYLTLEAVIGFQLVHLDQYLVITYG